MATLFMFRCWIDFFTVCSELSILERGWSWLNTWCDVSPFLHESSTWIDERNIVYQMSVPSLTVRCFVERSVMNQTVLLAKASRWKGCDVIQLWRSQPRGIKNQSSYTTYIVLYMKLKVASSLIMCHFDAVYISKSVKSIDYKWWLDHQCSSYLIMVDHNYAVWRKEHLLWSFNKIKIVLNGGLNHPLIRYS